MNLDEFPTIWDTIDRIRKGPATYIIELIGGDDTTRVAYLASPTEEPTLQLVANAINRESEGGKPTFHVYTTRPADEDDPHPVVDRRGNRWAKNTQLA